MSHLRIVIDGHDVALPDDVSIDITDTNPYLNDSVETYSYPFSIPIEPNRHLFGSIDHINDDRRLFSIEGKPMEIYIDNILFRSGKVAPIDEQEIIDSISISMVSSKKQLKDLVSDLNLRDIPTPEEDQNDLQIGEMIGDITVSKESVSNYSINAHIYGTAKINGKTFNVVMFYQKTEGTDRPEGEKMVQPNALGMSCTKEYKCYDVEPFSPVLDSEDNLIINKDFINTSYPCGETVIQPDNTTRRALYHNARVSYLHHRKDSDGKNSDYVQNEPEGYGPYYVLDADRQQSGTCFYLLYVLEAIFKYIEVDFDLSELYAVEDLRRLSFFTTLCTYDLVDKKTKDNKVMHFVNSEDLNNVNQWLTDRNTCGALHPGSAASESAIKSGTITLYRKYYFYSNESNMDDGMVKVTTLAGSKGSYQGCVCAWPNDAYRITLAKGEAVDAVITDIRGNESSIRLRVDKFAIDDRGSTYKYSANVKKMIANFQCLPDMDVTSFFDSLWASFGIRFDYDSERNFVKASLIRNVLRSNTDPYEIYGKIFTQRKYSERITGVRMRYSQESDPKSQLSNIRNKSTDYDTDYDYIVEKSQSINANLDYVGISRGLLSVNDMTCYVDRNTGNAYRIKLSKEALDNGKIDALKPTVFRVATYHGITEYIPELQGRSADDLARDPDVESNIHDITSDFQPLIQNDLNFGKSPSLGTLYAPFVDEDMWNEEVVMGPLQHIFDSNDALVFYIQAESWTNERYDTQSGDGQSPLQHMDWGNCITIMRGGGADAHVEYFDYNYDGFGNSKYRISGGKYQMDSDSISPYGTLYDYNGDLPGIDVNPSSYYGPYDNRYDGTYTHAEAAAAICDIWKESNADLISLLRRVPAATMTAKGWTVTNSDDFCTVFSQSRALTDSDGKIHEFLITPITDNGQVLSTFEFESYLTNLQQLAASTGRSIMNLDAERDQDVVIGLNIGRHLFIQQFDDVNEGTQYHSPWSDFYSEILHQFHAIYYGDADSGEVKCPFPATSQRVSLCIRTYFRDKDGTILCNTENAYRGLADTFMPEYIYFLLHRKKEHFNIDCKMQYLIDPSWLHRHSINGEVGWIDQIKTKASNANGIENIDIDMFVL